MGSQSTNEWHCSAQQVQVMYYQGLGTALQG